MFTNKRWYVTLWMIQMIIIRKSGDAFQSWQHQQHQCHSTRISFDESSSSRSRRISQIHHRRNQVISRTMNKVTIRNISRTNMDVSTTTTTTPTGNKRNNSRISVHEKHDTSFSNMNVIMESPLSEMKLSTIALPVIAILGSFISVFLMTTGITIHDITIILQEFIHDPQTILHNVVDHVQDMGPIGIVYFGIMYIIAEVFAIPAIPLTLSAGYLFGIPMGVSVVLLSATIAACIAFVIGKTILRSFVEEIIQNNTQISKIDTIISERGFKLLVLLRLSPIFPFAISNYIYGASSIDFVSYFWATLIGFAPGTIAYVYTGMVGKEMMFHDSMTTSQPWYMYAFGLCILVGFMKIISDVATGIFESIQDNDEDHSPL